MSSVIVFEDEDLVVIDKPQGLAVTPGAGSSLCAAFFTERPDLAAVAGFKPGEGGLLNRLDNDTGGLVLFAKHENAFRHFALEMRAGRVRKTYLAVVDGRTAIDAGTIDLAIGHSPKSARRMLVSAPGRPLRGRPRPARTTFKVLETSQDFSLLEVSIVKGVRHQIRVHLAALGCPIVGDKLYNRKGSAERAPFHLLYCIKVTLPAPGTGGRVVQVPAPWRDTWHSLTT